MCFENYVTQIQWQWGRGEGERFSDPRASDKVVAQICNLSVSVGIVASRANLIVLFLILFLVLVIEAIEEGKEDEEDLWLRLGRAAPYRRFATCWPPGSSGALPIKNRRYGRLQICDTRQALRPTLSLALGVQCKLN